MIPNLPNYKVIKLNSRNPLNVHIKTTYANEQKSFLIFYVDSDIQKYPIVSKIDEKCEAYNEGLRVGDKIIKLNDYSLEYKDIKTIICDFKFERKKFRFYKINNIIKECIF